jgi:hypothetical protein
MMYLAYLCYQRTWDDDEPAEVIIQFVEPERYRYSKVVPIQFSVLHDWTDADKELYKDEKR